MRSKRLTVVGLVMGLVVGGTLAFAGITFAASSPPTSINTCTKVNKHGVVGKTKVTTASSCSGKSIFQTWSDSATVNQELAAASIYKQLLIDASTSAGATVSYAGVNFTNMELPISGVIGCTSSCSPGGLGDFTDTNFTNATLSYDFKPPTPTCSSTARGGGWIGDNFAGANLTHSYMACGLFESDIFAGANFTNANLEGSSFTGSTMGEAIYNNTICPNGTISNSDTGTCAGEGGGL
jgi:uncharacterized protein YjbI with pentapeptide repeats